MSFNVADRDEDFTADPVELFFDLAFVFAFAQLVRRLIEEPTWTGVGQAGLLFSLLWLGWSQFTWSANAVNGANRSVRFVMLVATAASVPMAASISTAYDAGGPAFSISLAIIVTMGVSLVVLGYDNDTEEFRSALRYAGPTLAALALLVIGGFVEQPWRTVVFLASVAVFIGGTARAGGQSWVVRPGHFAERHGLILIVALGEVIVAIAIPVVEALSGEEADGLSGETLAALAAAGVFAGLMWWSYFDRVQPALEHRSSQLTGGARARFSRDAYTYLHLPTVGGVLMAAAALEEITLHPGDELYLEFALMLAGGLGLYLASIEAMAMRAYSVVPPERAIGALAIVAVALLGRRLDGLVLLILIDLVLFVMLVVEHLRVEARPRRQEEAAAA